MDRASHNDISFTEASDLRKGALIILKNKVVKVKELNWSCQGKHGAAKYHIVAYTVFGTEKRVEETVGAHERVTVPVPLRYDADVIELRDDTLTVYDTARKEAHDRLELDGDIPLHADIAARVRAGEELTLDVLAAFGHEKIVAVKVRKD